jgi:hypothetical protein
MAEKADQVKGRLPELARPDDAAGATSQHPKDIGALLFGQLDSSSEGRRVLLRQWLHHVGLKVSLRSDERVTYCCDYLGMTSKQAKAFVGYAITSLM